MDERNLRAAHLAEELGVGRDYVGRWLKGGGIREDHLEAVAEHFDSTPAWIITGTGPMHLSEAGGDVPGVDLLREPDEDQAEGDVEAPASQP